MMSLNTGTCVPYDTAVRSLDDGNVMIFVRQNDVPPECFVPAVLDWYLPIEQAKTLHEQLGAALNALYVASSNKSAGAVEVTA